MNGFTSRQKLRQKLWFWTKIQQTADEQYFQSAASKIWKTSDLLFAYFFDCIYSFHCDSNAWSWIANMFCLHSVLLSYFSPVCSYASLVVDRWNPNVWNVVQRDLLHNYNYDYNCTYNCTRTQLHIMTVGQANRGIIKFSWGLISRQCGIFLRLSWIKYKKIRFVQNKN